jgi:hypothetical protein
MVGSVTQVATLPGVPTSKPFVHLILEPELMERIDDFRFTHRYASRTAAIRFLIEAGLQFQGVVHYEDLPEARRKDP